MAAILPITVIGDMNMKILTTISKTTGQTCYYDGIRFALLREYAYEFENEKAAAMKAETLTTEYMQPVIAEEA
mgnify:FL=1